MINQLLQIFILSCPVPLIMRSSYRSLIEGGKGPYELGPRRANICETPFEAHLAP